jgi:peptide/nickel transport system permease protein
VLRFIVRKFIQGILMVAVVSVITFALLSNAGGDALTSLRDNPQVSEETIEKLRQHYGLDRPVMTRYLDWVSSSLGGDLGESFQFRTNVLPLVLSRLWNTILLGGVALVIAWSIAIGLSYLSALLKKRPLDRFIEVLILISASTPRIVLALFALALFVRSTGTAMEIRTGSASSFLVSAFVLAVPLIALFLAQGHSELTSAMNEESIRMARAKGLSEPVIIRRHASRFALNPLLTVFGLSLGAIIGGSVIVETILGWSGVGALMVTAVRSRDVPLVMGIVVMTTIVVWLGNSIAEILQLVNDKRLRVAEMNLR